MYGINTASVVFIAIVLGFVWRGYRRGFVGSIARVVSMLIAYPTAIFFTKSFAGFLIEVTPLDGLLAYFAAGMIIFAVTSAVVGMLLKRLTAVATADEELSTASRFSGAVAGFMIGGILGLLAVYAISLMQPLVPTALAATPDASRAGVAIPPGKNQASVAKPRNLLEYSARKLASAIATTAADLVFDDDTTTEMTRTFVEEPQTVLGHVQQLLDDREQIVALMNDQRVAAMVANNDIDGLMRVPEFQALMSNEHIQALMPPSNATGQDNVRKGAQKMVSAWGRINRISNHPEFIAILSDPELQQQLQSPDLALMMNPKLNKLTEILFSR